MIMLVAFLFVAVSGKLFYVQIVDSKNLQSRAAEQWYRDVPITARRGGIYDRNKTALADTATKYTVYVRPNAVTEPEKVAKVLSVKAGADFQKLLNKLIKKGVSEITVAKKIEKSVMLSIVSEQLDGIYFSTDSFRYYPYGNFMTQILGFTNIDGVGQSGLEAYYNKYLTGVNGQLLTEADLVGRELSGNATTYLPSVSGLDLITTLDYTIQNLVENAIKTAQIKHQAKRVSCLVMNPTTGEILAMAETPSFDLNNIPRDDLSQLFAYSKNSMVSSVYEPGSTFKILTSAIALQENAFSDSHRFYCSGSRIVDGKKIKCWRAKGHGSQTFVEGVCNSCNCVFMDCALAVGKDTFYQYLYDLGINRKTGIDVSGETSGLMLKPSTVKNVDLARIGFGQAIALTPIELAVAASACINGGEVVTPYILDSVVDEKGNVIHKNTKKVVKNVIRPEISAELRDILTKVVTQGSGKGAYLKGYSIGGKTGTAQKYDKGNIAQGKYFSSFIGYTMIKNTEAMILFIVDEPVGIYYGSIVAAPYVAEIFKGIFDYRQIKPSYNGDELLIVGIPIELADFYGMSTSQATIALHKLGVNVEVDGEGNTVKSQLPIAGTMIDKTNTVLLYT
ncbi:MAG: penicillin-binding transpeptidase domain-containing protein [Clostridia bacterium]